MYDSPGVHLVLDHEVLRRDSRDPFPFRVKVVTKAGHIEWPTLHGDTPAWAKPYLVPKYLREEAQLVLVCAREGRRQVDEYRSGPG